MKRTTLGIVLLVLCCQAAQARAVFASVPKMLTISGKCSKAADWTPEGVPNGASDVVVPEGKTLHAEGSTCYMRSIDLQGTLTGQGTVNVGSSLRAEGLAGLDVAVKIGPHGVWLDQGLHMTGEYLGSPQILDMGPSAISNFTIDGPAHYQLGEAAHFESIWTMKEDTSFDTAGYWIGGMGDTQVGLPATLKLHGSEWDTGEWRVAAPVVLEADEATVYQDDGSYGVTECHGQTLGNLIVKNFRPHLVNPCTIPGTLSLDQTADHSPIVFSGTFLPNERLETTRLTIGNLATNGTAERPVVCEGRATIVLLHDEEVKGALDVSEWTVEGGTLYDPEGAETASTGVVIAPEP